MKDVLNETLLNLFKEVHQNVLIKVQSKFNDYGAEPLLEFDDFGVFMKTISKVNRLKNFYKGKSMMVDENVEDTLIDLAAYAIWGLAVRKYVESKNKKEKETENEC
jgi:hypothetical protein